MTAPQEPTAPPRAGAYGLALGALFFLSGALGLLYEIVWFRRLHLTLGVSLFAVGAVVSAFMLGLAVGSRWAARSAWLRRSPLTAYAGLELGIALYALAFPLLVGALEALYPALFRLLEGHPPGALGGAVRPGVPSPSPAHVPDGGEPARDGRGRRRAPGQLARRVAWLYALNTVGGVAGTLVAGFVLIERLGITAQPLRRGRGQRARRRGGLRAVPPCHPEGLRSDGSRGSTGTANPSAAVRSADAPRRHRLARALVAGAVSLASEIVWTRALVFFVHNSTYAFSAILAVYLLGIAAGALVAARFARTRTSALRSLAVDARRERRRPPGGDRRLPAPARGGGAPGRRATSRLPARPARRPGCDVGVELGTGARPHLRPGGGRALPARAPPRRRLPAHPRARSGERTGRPRLVGRLYAVQRRRERRWARCSARSCSWPLLGTRGALLLLAWLPVPIALWALREAIPPGRARTAIAGALRRRPRRRQPARRPARVLPGPLREAVRPRRLVRGGVTETVAVCEHKDGSRWIQFSDGRGASGTWSFQGGWLYAHLPLLLHPRPRSAAVVCFGTGNTLGAASLHPLTALDGIESRPEVVEAAPLFAATNHGVTTSGRARIVIEDGRSYMLATDRRYDVITEEPPLVHTAGVVNLYSRDFDQLCARRLTDDGIFAVWLATWKPETPEMRMLVRAFVDAFPHASLWDCTHPGEWLLLGSKRPLRVDLDALGARMAAPAIARDLARIDADAGGIRSPADLLSSTSWAGTASSPSPATPGRSPTTGRSSTSPPRGPAPTSAWGSG